MDDYTESEVRHLLAEDARIAEQAVEVRRRGDTLVLTGEVETPQRRADIERLIAAEFPDVPVHSDIGIIRTHEPDEVEEVM